ncbi:hypothetical protein OtV6_025c [Ostreococcus tauri virus RT-2011]|nr:hypothetical protein OtV6_025c [Ostreococcus tauri virus RT-2011]
MLSSLPTKPRYSSRVKSLGSEFSSMRTSRMGPYTSSVLKGVGKVFWFKDSPWTHLIITTSRSGHCPINVAGPPNLKKISFLRGSISKSISCIFPNCSFISTATVILNSHHKKISIECK